VCSSDLGPSCPHRGEGVHHHRVDPGNRGPLPHLTTAESGDVVPSLDEKGLNRRDNIAESIQLRLGCRADPNAIRKPALCDQARSGDQQEEKYRRSRISTGPADTPVYASGNTSRSRLQDLRPGGFAVFLSCRAPSSPTTCLFIPALPGLPVIRNTLKTVIEDGFRALAKLLDLTTPADRPLFFIRL